MTRNLVTCTPGDSLYKCAKLMAKDRVNTLPITKDKKLVGIITSRDILWTITKKPKADLKNLNVMKIATRKVAVVKPSADISQALSKMQSLNFRRLPVLSKGELIGMVTLKDILSIDPTLYSEIQELMELREQDRKSMAREEQWPEAGLCDNCGAFSELLKVDNQILCADCRDELY